MEARRALSRSRQQPEIRDACPYLLEGRLLVPGCAAAEPLPPGSQLLSLAVLQSKGSRCRYLVQGMSNERPYPRCQLGDAESRARWLRALEA